MALQLVALLVAALVAPRRWCYCPINGNNNNKNYNNNK